MYVIRAGGEAARCLSPRFLLVVKPLVFATARSDCLNRRAMQAMKCTQSIDMK